MPSDTEQPLPIPTWLRCPECLSTGDRIVHSDSPLYAECLHCGKEWRYDYVTDDADLSTVRAKPSSSAYEDAVNIRRSEIVRAARDWADSLGTGWTINDTPTQILIQAVHDYREIIRAY